jgi:hypothetical protein
VSQPNFTKAHGDRRFIAVSGLLLHHHQGRDLQRGRSLLRIFFHFDRRLLQWARRKYRNLRCNARRRQRWRKKVMGRNPRLFTHWLALGWIKVRTMGAV